MSFLPADFYVITHDSIEKGWTPNKEYRCPILELGSFPIVLTIFFPDYKKIRPIYHGSFGINPKTGKANVFPSSLVTPTAIAIIQVERDNTRSSEITLPRYKERDCPYQGREIILEGDKEEYCPHCGVDLYHWFVWETYGSIGVLGMRIIDIPMRYYTHPPLGEVCTYYPPISVANPEKAGPRCYGRSEFSTGNAARDADAYVVRFEPGECLRIKGNKEEFILYGLDRQWYRSETFDDLFNSGQYDMSHTNDYINALEEMQEQTSLAAKFR